MEKRGISPVLTTVVIVAVAIPVAIAVAIWMYGLVGAFTRFEKLQITSSWASLASGTFTIKTDFRNTGSSDTTVTQVMIDGTPYDQWSGTTVTPKPSILAPVGEALSLEVQFPDNSTNGDAFLTSGVTATITLHTSGGRDYSISVSLP